MGPRLACSTAGTAFESAARTLTLDPLPAPAERCLSDTHNPRSLQACAALGCLTPCHHVMLRSVVVQWSWHAPLVPPSPSAPPPYLLGVWLGYVDSYSESVARSRLFIAVSSSGEVFCVDTATRRTLWSRNIADLDADGDRGAAVGGATIAEVSALINPHPMRTNDTGVVVVAVRRVSSSPDASGDDNTVRAPTSHLSYFAFSGRTGALRWRHSSSDFLSPSSSPVSSASVLHEQHSVHTGEVEWRNYRHDVIAAMPHSWYTHLDTRLTLAQVTPPNRAGQRSTSKQAADKASSSVRAASRATQMLPSSLSVHTAAKQAHDDSEHIEHPNAIVAHTRDGIEVLALYTGRPITHLPLEAQQTHADINADGVIDHLTVIRPLPGAGAGGVDDGALSPSSSSWQSQLTPCLAVVSSHIPPSAELFNVSVCSSAVDQLLAIHFMQAAAGLGRGRRPGGRYGPAAPFLGRRNRRVGRERRASNGTVNSDEAVEVGQNGSTSADGRSEREMAADDDGWQRTNQPSSKQSAAVPLVVPDTRLVSGGGGQPFVSFFLSSSGLLSAVDARGTKLFTRRTAAQFEAADEAVSSQQLTRRVIQYDVKQDGTMVRLTLTTQASARFDHRRAGATIACRLLTGSLLFWPPALRCILLCAQPCVLLVGDQSVAVVRRDDGSAVAEMPLASSTLTAGAIRSIVCSDVNSDGYSDVVLQCEREYVVLSLSVHRGSSLFPRLLSCLLCALIAAICAQLAILFSPAVRDYVQRLDKSIAIKRNAHVE